MLKRVLVNLYSLIEAIMMAVEAVNCSDSFSLGKSLIIEVNIVMNAIRKSSQNRVVLRQAVVTVIEEIHIEDYACTHICKIVLDLLFCP